MRTLVTKTFFDVFTDFACLNFNEGSSYPKLKNWSDTELSKRVTHLALLKSVTQKIYILKKKKKSPTSDETIFDNRFG